MHERLLTFALTSGRKALASRAAAAERRLQYPPDALESPAARPEHARLTGMNCPCVSVCVVGQSAICGRSYSKCQRSGNRRLPIFFFLSDHAVVQQTRPLSPHVDRRTFLGGGEDRNSDHAVKPPDMPATVYAPAMTAGASTHLQGAAP